MRKVPDWFLIDFSSIYGRCSIIFFLLYSAHISQAQAPKPISKPIPNPQSIQSAALSLHYELPELGFSYKEALHYIKRLGASHVAINVQATMSTIYASNLAFTSSEASSLQVVEHVIQQAQALGLKIIIFPILWIEKRAHGEWRGQLKPKNEDLWWSAYEAWLGDLAVLAQKYKADYLSIGSELSSLEKQTGRWLALIRRIRALYSGKLTYSANWDHFADVPFWSFLDTIGLTAYYPLLEAGETAEISKLYDRWCLIKSALIDWQAHHYPNKKLFFTELGYPSQVGGLSQPWHYLQEQEIDLKGQAMAFEAFRKAWQDSPSLLGVNIWNLWGLGGPYDTWYTVRGKPAAQEILKLFKELSGRYK